MLNKLYVIASSEGIGGAESRTVKYAVYAAKTLDIPVVLVVNENLFRCIEENLFLKSLLAKSLIKVQLYKPSWGVLSEGFRNVILKNPRFKAVLHLFPRWFLKQISWYPYLKSELKPGNFVHCIFGDTARIGTYFISQLRLGAEIGSIVEITSNRHVDTWARHINFCLKNFQASKSNLNIQCVSETVLSNLMPRVDRNIQNIIGAYSGPFILIPRPNVVVKKNVIVFAHRFIAPKNPVLFAEIISEMCDEGLLVEWEIYIRGRGGQQAKMEQILNRQIESGQVSIGFTGKLIEELNKSKIFVSIIETGNYPSNSLFEAMRTGNIVVLSDKGITKEKIGSGKGVYYLRELSHSELKKALVSATRVAASENYMEYSNSVESMYQSIALNSGYVAEVNEMYKYER